MLLLTHFVSLSKAPQVVVTLCNAEQATEGFCFRVRNNSVSDSYSVSNMIGQITDVLKELVHSNHSTLLHLKQLNSPAVGPNTEV